LLPMSHVDNAGKPNELLRVLGVGFGVAAVIGSVIGVGILRVPGAIAGDFSSPVAFLMVWVVAAAVAMLGANIVSELSTMMPQAGGPYLFIRRGLGAYPGFLFGWIDWLISVGSGAAVIVTFSAYVLRLLPGVPGRESSVIVATALLLVAIHLAGLRSGDRVQTLLSAAKAAMFVLFGAACISLGDQSGWRVLPHVTEIPWWATIALAGRAMLMVNEAYGGWNIPVYMAEEQRDPARSVPRAMFIGIAGVCFLYLLINAGLLAVLPLSDIAGSNLPIADAMARIAGHGAGQLVTLLALVSLASIAFTSLFQTPRILLALARDGWCHRSATNVSAVGVPRGALLISSALTLLLALTGTFEVLFLSVAMLSILTDGTVALSFFVLRFREPDAPRPYRARLYPWLPGIFVLYTIVVVAAAGLHEPEAALRSAAVVVVSVPAFLWLRSRHRKASSRAAGAFDGAITSG
jgi:APA family basic amino acid/polyamine antiporter